MPASGSKERLVCVAAVAAAHGVRGALRLRCFTEEPESVVAYGPLLDRTGAKLLDAEIIGHAKGGVIVRAAGIEDRNAAETLRGTELFVPRSALPEPDADEFYHEDLIGLRVLDAEGAVIGRVVAVDDYGGGEILGIALDAGGSLDLPFTREAVPTIDLEAGTLTVVPPEETVAGPGENAA